LFLIPCEHCRQESQPTTKLFTTPGSKKRARARQMELKVACLSALPVTLLVENACLSGKLYITYLQPNYLILPLVPHHHHKGQPNITSCAGNRQMSRDGAESDVFMDSSNELKKRLRTGSKLTVCNFCTPASMNQHCNLHQPLLPHSSRFSSIVKPFSFCTTHSKNSTATFKST